MNDDLGLDDLHANLLIVLLIIAVLIFGLLAYSFFDKAVKISRDSAAQCYGPADQCKPTIGKDK